MAVVYSPIEANILRTALPRRYENLRIVSIL
jgi:hypothetical protein